MKFDHLYVPERGERPAIAIASWRIMALYITSGPWTLSSSIHYNAINRKKVCINSSTFSSHCTRSVWLTLVLQFHKLFCPCDAFSLKWKYFWIRIVSQIYSVDRILVCDNPTFQSRLETSTPTSLSPDDANPYRVHSYSLYHIHAWRFLPCFLQLLERLGL